MKRTLISLIAAFVVLSSFCVADEPLLNQMVVIDGISARVRVEASLGRPHGAHEIFVHFDVAQGAPINRGCLTASHDFRYELRDSRGSIVPLNEQGLNVKYAPFGPTSLEGNFPCELAPYGPSARFLVLSVLYPNLAPGTYKLQITFAPRGFSQQVTLRPVILTVDESHPL